VHLHETRPTGEPTHPPTRRIPSLLFSLRGFDADESIIFATLEPFGVLTTNIITKIADNIKATTDPRTASLSFLLFLFVPPQSAHLSLCCPLCSCCYSCCSRDLRLRWLRPLWLGISVQACTCPSALPRFVCLPAHTHLPSSLSPFFFPLSLHSDDFIHQDFRV
jgi:hypothetical protein